MGCYVVDLLRWVFDLGSLVGFLVSVCGHLIVLDSLAGLLLALRVDCVPWFLMGMGHMFCSA